MEILGCLSEGKQLPGHGRPRQPRRGARRFSVSTGRAAGSTSAAGSQHGVLMSLREPAVWQTPGVVAAGR
jgi:hypothetical protein